MLYHVASNIASVFQGWSSSFFVMLTGATLITCWSTHRQGPPMSISQQSSTWMQQVWMERSLLPHHRYSFSLSNIMIVDKKCVHSTSISYCHKSCTVMLGMRFHQMNQILACHCQIRLLGHSFEHSSCLSWPPLQARQTGSRMDNWVGPALVKLCSRSEMKIIWTRWSQFCFNTWNSDGKWQSFAYYNIICQTQICWWNQA